ncbi:hypothetical protein OIU77_005017 [Salix suchowensis]|uniref:Uncharacterized protein n=1 Tax=Salix suchowensis TaxID=1278906 RepID=A0ABQ9AYD5_9ROSI|nr:hypothetical protein OIU77_005017 [Salix suchowensis]
MAYRRRQQQHDEETSGTSSRSRPSPITTATSSSSSSPLDGEDWSYEDVRVLNDSNIKNKSNSASLATKAIRASSAAHRDSSLSSAYAFPNHPSPSPSPSSDSSNFNSSSTKEQESNKAFYHEYTSMKAMKETKQQQGFWGTLARKAKSILDDDFDADNNNAPSPPPPQKQHQHQQLDSATDRTTTRQHNVPDYAMPKYQNQFPSRETYRKTESPAFQKGLNAISSSLKLYR